MSTVQLFGYLRPHSGIKPHQINSCSEKELADALSWSPHDWREDPEWPCVAIGQLSITRESGDKMTEQMVASLRKVQAKVRAESEAQIVEIDRQINSLLAIAHEVQA